VRRLALVAAIGLAAGCSEDPVTSTTPPDSTSGPPPDTGTTSIRPVDVRPAGAALQGQGATQTFELYLETGERVTGDSISWASGRPAVARVDSATGEATARASGQAVIEARINGRAAAHAVVTVSVPGAPPVEWALQGFGRPDLHGVWGRDGQLWSATENGTVVWYDGADWHETEWASAPLYGVATTPSGEIFVVGDDVIVREDGGVRDTVYTTVRLYAVWADASGEAMAVGENGVALRYADGVWYPQETGIEVDLHDVWGVLPDTVFLVGGSGTIVRRDGGGWQPMATGTDRPVTSISGSGPEDLYATADTTLLHYDGTRWHDITPDTEADVFRAVAAVSSDDVYVIGGVGPYYQRRRVVLRYDGASWGEVYRTSAELRQLWAGPGPAVVATGDDGAVVVGRDGSWTLQSHGLSPLPVPALWGVSAHEVFAVQHDRLLRRTATAQWETSRVPGLYGRELTGIRGSGLDDVVVVGTDYAVLRRDTLGWHNRTLDVSEVVDAHGAPADFTGVWSAGPRSVFIVGEGLIVHYDGAFERAWSSTTPLHGVWGTARDHVLAVGGADRVATVLRHDGTDWAPMARAPGGPLRGVWGTSPSDVFAVGDGGLVLHYDGAAWTEMAVPTDRDLTAVWGTAPGDVYAVGDRVVLRYDGASWQPLEAAPAIPYLGIWGSTDGPIYLAATRGRIVYARR
jgi:hypothetical protein